MRGVKNSYSHEINFWPYVKRNSTNKCWAWIGNRQKVGYGQIWKDGRPQGAHRIAWEIANGRKAPSNRWVLHRCDNPNCVNPNHLFLGTPKDNHQDQIAKGRRPIIRPFSKRPELIKRGEDASAAKLREFQVLEIRRKAALGQSQTLLSKQFGVSPSNINRIVNRTRWKHLCPGHNACPA